MRIKITAGGIYDGEGKEIPIGTELDVADFEVDDEGRPVEPHPWGERFTVVSGSKKGKTGATGDAPPPPPPPPPPVVEFVAPVGPFTAKEKSPGWWAIYDGKGATVGKAARKADLDGFDTLSDEDKLAFATAHAQAAFDAAQAKA